MTIRKVMMTMKEEMDRKRQGRMPEIGNEMGRHCSAYSLVLLDTMTYM